MVVGFKVEERLARSLTRGTSRDTISRVCDLPIIVTYKRTLVTLAGKQKAKFFFNSQESQRYQLKNANMTETRALSAQKWGLRAFMECATGILTVLRREILMSSNFPGASLQ